MKAGLKAIQRVKRLFLLFAALYATDENAGLDVDATLFLTGENVSIDTVSCTLVNGTQTLCYEITSKHTAEEHDMGPWCPETIYDIKRYGF